MMDARHLSNALDALSGDMGAFAGYAANKEAAQEAAQQQDRRDAANKAFQAALENARMQQQQDQFNASKAQQQSQFEDTKAFQQQELSARTDYQNRSLAQQEAFKNASLGIENKRLGIEQQNADTAKAKASADTAKAKADHLSGVIGARLTATGKLIQSYERQRDAELGKLASDVNLMGDPKSLAAAQQRVNAKYQPLIDKRQKDYDALNKKFSEMNGIDMGDADTAATIGDMTSNVNPSAPSSNGTETDDNPAGLPTAADAVNAGTAGSQPPVPGARQAPDGNWYVPDPKRPGSYLRVDD